MRTTIHGDILTVFPEENITSSNAEQLGKAFMEILGQNPEKKIEIDMGEVEYISSAGLRILLACSKKLAYPLTIRNVLPQVHDILDITGFTSILDVHRKMREISVDGCEVIGRGAQGTVYKLDEETIVKVFHSPDSLSLIQVEQEKSKQALISGIPTAISYDIVKVGENYGSVFELLRARNLNDVFLESPDQELELLRKYVDLIRRIHAVEAKKGSLPDSRTVFLQYADDLQGVLPEDVSTRIKELLQSMPEDLHFVHGDLQMKNVMLNGDDLILIDMETLSVGNPVFDLQGPFVTYAAYTEDEPDNLVSFLGLTQEKGRLIWEKILEYYFCDRDENARREAENRIRILGYLRFLDRVVTHGMTREDLKETRIRHSVEHLRELLPLVDSLGIRPPVSGM